MIIFICVVLAIVIIVGSILVSTSGELSLTRRAVFSERASDIYPYLVDLHKFKRWAPWMREAGVTFDILEGSERRHASIMWQSTKSAGDIEVADGMENRRILHHLHLSKPKEVFVGCVFILDDDGNQTTLVWNVLGKRSLLARLVPSFGVEGMIGDYINQGFSCLKTVIANDKYT